MRWFWLTGVGVLSILLPVLVLGDRSNHRAASTSVQENLYTGALPELEGYASDLPDSQNSPHTLLHPVGLPTSFPTLDPTQKLPKCVGGCSLDKHPKSFLGIEKFYELIKAYALEEPSKESASLDELLFHDAQVRGYLGAADEQLMDEKHRSFLARESSRTHVFLSVRIIDEHGIVRGEKLDTRIPLDIKQHLHFDNPVRLQGFSVNGTVKRVGLHYLWSRW